MKLIVGLLMLVLAACGGGLSSGNAVTSPDSGLAEPTATTDDRPQASSTHGSRYSGLAEADCKLVERDEETGSSRSRCPGVDGYLLDLLDDDARMSIDVIAPDGNVHPLDLWSVVSTSFSSLGNKAEWRQSVASQVPEALIVRFMANEFPDEPQRSTSYLVVARLSGQPVCVIAKVAPGSDQNVRARELADRAATLPCLPDGT